MTKVDFYTGTKDKLRTACQLSNKAMQAGQRVLLHSPDAMLIQSLDRLLWQFPATAFIPHCRSEEEQAPTLPVVLDTRGEFFPHSEILINLHTESLLFFSRFQRCIELVGETDDEARLGRMRYKFYKDRGYELRHFDLKKQAE